MDGTIMQRVVLFVALVVGVSTVGVGFGDHKESMEASLHRPEGLKWQDGPVSLPPGAKIAVLEGDPTKLGPFVFRVKVPDGYRIPPHTPKARAGYGDLRNLQPRDGRDVRREQG